MRDIQQALSGATNDKQLPKKYYLSHRYTKFFTVGISDDDLCLVSGYSFIGSQHLLPV